MTVHLAAERLRLRRHFAAVLAELHPAPLPPGASPERRARTLRELARYARAGAFPRHGGRGTPRPVFVDSGGRRCAMAHLLEWNGDAGPVRRIAASRNHAYVPALAADAGVAGAIRSLGVSVEEAARIQPCYYPSALQCLGAFALQWGAAAAAGWLGVRLVGGIRAWRGGLPVLGTHPLLLGVGVAAALVLVLAGVGSHQATTWEPEPYVPGGDLSFCGAGEDYSICGSGFRPGDVARQIAAALYGRPRW